MKKFFGCLRGDSSQRQSTQEPPQQQAAQDPPLQQVLANHGVTFEWEDIIDGTQNFQGSNLLGEGEFGRVYRCDFPSQGELGIKHLNPKPKVGAAKIQKSNNSQAETEFKAEITTLHRANQPNVIRLLGKVLRSGSLCVVYEFMPNGSLDHHLFGKPRWRSRQEVPCLDWNKRIRIALGVAEALVYLHNVLKVIHRDIKSSNVLLDGEFVPKLTDFGLAIRIMVGEDGVERETVIRPNKGTFGFRAPEREQFGSVSTKSDVYGYGILLFELFTGKKAYDSDRPTATMTMTGWLRSIRYSEDAMIDVKLGDRYSVEGLKRLFQAARMCIEPEASARPNMDIVEQMVRQASAYILSDSPTVST